MAGVEEFVRGREGEIVIQHGAPAPEIGRDIIHEVTLEGDLDQAWIEDNGVAAEIFALRITAIVLEEDAGKTVTEPTEGCSEKQRLS